MMKCKICGSDTRLVYDQQFKIKYYRCPNCEFLFMEDEAMISFDEARAVYDTHENSIDNQGYVDMFKGLIEDFVKPLKISGRVLDFGSGPGPVLYQLLTEEGLDAFHFDPFYNPDNAYKDSLYQLITSTEVVEHFFDPIKEFKHLSSLLEKNGYLLIMTHIRNKDLDVFLNWWYRRDVTHVSFYHLNTFKYIAQVCGLERIKHNDKNIILFKKK